MKLPATRELAQSLGVNRATVALAYEELVAAGLARAHVGQGTFVAGEPPTRAAAGRRGAGARRPSTGRRSSRAARASSAADEERAARGWRRRRRRGGVVISFAGGMPDSALFPTDAFRRVLNQVVREEGDALLQYYPVGGYPPLRRYLAALPAALRRRGARRRRSSSSTARSRASTSSRAR